MYISYIKKKKKKSELGHVEEHVNISLVLQRHPHNVSWLTSPTTWYAPDVVNYLIVLRDTLKIYVYV